MVSSNSLTMSAAFKSTFLPPSTTSPVGRRARRLRRARRPTGLVVDGGRNVDLNAADIVNEFDETIKVDHDEAIYRQARQCRDRLLSGGHGPFELETRALVEGEVAGLVPAGIVGQPVQHVGVCIGRTATSGSGVVLSYSLRQRDALRVARYPDHGRLAGLDIDVEHDHCVRSEARVA